MVGELSGLICRKLLVVFELLIASPDSFGVSRVIGRPRLGLVKLTIGRIVQVVVHDNFIRLFIASFRCSFEGSLLVSICFDLIVKWLIPGDWSLITLVVPRGVEGS